MFSIFSRQNWPKTFLIRLHLEIVTTQFVWMFVCSECTVIACNFTSRCGTRVKKRLWSIVKICGKPLPFLAPFIGWKHRWYCSWHTSQIIGSLICVSSMFKKQKTFSRILPYFYYFSRTTIIKQDWLWYYDYNVVQNLHKKFFKHFF